MTKFVKANFEQRGEYVYYVMHDVKRASFVARFKHRGPFTKAKFLKELIANHTVEGYFAELEAGKAPLAILRDANEAWYYATIEAYYGRPVGAAHMHRVAA
jgi:hypothetical protein